MRPVLFLAFALAACATPPESWRKPGASLPDAQQAFAECNYESMQLAYGVLGKRADLINACMEARGWRR
jgi:starvation-inducible outer membrane lipoprotein